MNQNQSTQPRKVLVVDDDPVIRDMMADILNDEGYNVNLARNGREALMAMNGEDNYFVFLDLMMPVMGGRDVCKALDNYPQVRKRHIIVLMSAMDNIEEVEALHVDVIMPKPFVVEDVLQALEAPGA
jgi:CheY-like chemotaxis protein